MSARPATRSLALALPAGTTLRFVVLLVAIITVTTRLGGLFVDRQLTTMPFSDDPACSASFGEAVKETVLTEDFDAYRQWLIDNSDCLYPGNPLPLDPPLFFLAVLVGLTVTQYLLGPWVRIARRRLVRLPLEDMPELRQVLEECRALTDVRVRFLVDLLNPRVGGVAFGYPGRRYVAVTHGLLVLARTDPEAFRTIVLHELGHVRNRDLDITALTLAVWRAFLVGVIVPFILLIIFDPYFPDMADEAWSTSSQLALIAVITLLLRNAVVRSREHYADAHAIAWSGSAEGLLRVLEGGRRDGWLRRLLRLHPQPEERRLALDGLRPLWVVPAREFLALGLVVGIAAPSVLQQFASSLPEGFILPEGRRHLGPGLLIVPVGLTLAPAVWRAVLFARFTGTRSRGVWLGVAFGAGLVAGPLLTPWDPLPVDVDHQALWSVTALAGCWLTAAWVALTARAWSRVTSASLALAAAGLCTAATAALLPTWLGPLLDGRLVLVGSELPATELVRRALAPGNLARLLDPSTALGRWLLLLAAVTVALPVLGLLTDLTHRGRSEGQPPRTWARRRSSGRDTWARSGLQ